ncbi:MAG: hypothetical protein AAF934_00055 [Bacteroidota bacterium]
MSNIKHRIFQIGSRGTNGIGDDFIVNPEFVFSFDRDDIYFDSSIRSFDEMY